MKIKSDRLIKLTQTNLRGFSDRPFQPQINDHPRTPIQYSESSPDLGLREFIICRDFVV
ncbi:MAG: hypothetical protein QNJ41_26765 [Xenococcaceae cyanobacterium MO_188.B32]|nr:hypothetical protein [Xenococcaceae cyanobacterium MO_188.B32]